MLSLQELLHAWPPSSFISFFCLLGFYRVNHSNNAILKPATKSSDKDRKDIDKAMRRVKEASSIIEDEIDPGMCY